MILIEQGSADNVFNVTLATQIGPTNYYRATFVSLYSPGNAVVVLPTVVAANPRYVQLGLDCSWPAPMPLEGQCNFYPYGSWRMTLDIAATLSLTASSLGVVMVDDTTVTSCSSGTSPYNFIPGP